MFIRILFGVESCKWRTWWEIAALAHQSIAEERTRQRTGVALATIEPAYMPDSTHND